MNLIIHADDFGLTIDQSQHILACSSACGGLGALNSTSALVNSPHFPACADMIRPFVDAESLRIGLHLNVVEGPSCAPAAMVPTLTGAGGMFCLSFARLLSLSGGKDRVNLFQELACEIGAQIDTFLTAFPNQRDHLRIDSHQHFHLIPVVFDALQEALQRRHCTVEYLRIPAEPMKPYTTTSSLYSVMPPINAAKNVLLNSLWKKNRDKLPEYRTVSAVFFGLMLSGRMEYAVNPELLHKFFEEGHRRAMDVEILFHPGGVSSIGECLDPSLQGFVDFYRSPHRQQEAQALARLEELLPTL